MEVQDRGAGRFNSGEGLLPGLLIIVFSFYPHMAYSREKKRSSYISSYKSTNFIYELLYHQDLITFQRLHLLIPSYWGLEFQHVNLKGQKYSAPNSNIMNGLPGCLPLHLSSDPCQGHLKSPTCVFLCLGKIKRLM